jgi:hypothetical protein
MSVTTVQAWHCSVCSYEWLKLGNPPLCCARRSCQSRKWNRDGVQPVTVQHGYQNSFKCVADAGSCSGAG